MTTTVTTTITLSLLINRACKFLISSSDDSILYDPLEENEYVDTAKGNVQQEIKNNANNETIGFENIEEAEIVDENEIREQHQEMVTETQQFEMAGPNF